MDRKEIEVGFDKNKLFAIELVIDIKKQEAIAIIDGKVIKTRIKKKFKTIDRVGYVGYKTKTEFTEILEK